MAPTDLNGLMGGGGDQGGGGGGGLPPGVGGGGKGFMNFGATSAYLDQQSGAAPGGQGMPTTAEGWRPAVASIVASYGPGLGIPAAAFGTWTDRIIKQIGTESHGNAGADNPNDSNGQGGTQHVSGLLQFLPSTYGAHNIANLPYPNPIGEIAATLSLVRSHGIGEDGGPPDYPGTIGVGHGFYQTGGETTPPGKKKGKWVDSPKRKGGIDWNSPLGPIGWLADAAGFNTGGQTGDQGGGGLLSLGASFVDDLAVSGMRALTSVGSGASGAFGKGLSMASKFLGPASLFAPEVTDMIWPQARTSVIDTTPINRGRPLRGFNGGGDTGGGLPPGSIGGVHGGIGEMLNGPIKPEDWAEAPDGLKKLMIYAWATKAAQAEGVDPARAVPALADVISRESGSAGVRGTGDPNVVNMWDTNWTKGDPSIGLAQVTPGTANDPGNANLPGANMADPVSNLRAALRHVRSRGLNIWDVPEAHGQQVGYQMGGEPHHGPITGFWQPGKDTTPIITEPGEYVTRRRSAQRMLPFLHWSNNARAGDLEKMMGLMGFLPGGPTPGSPDPSGDGGLPGALGGYAPGTQVDTIAIATAVKQAFPQVTNIGTVRAADGMNEHSSGEAADVMIPNWNSPEGQALGTQIKDFALGHPELGVEYAIWQQTEWDVGGGSTKYKDAGNPNDNHFTHVHIRTAGGGFKEGEQAQSGMPSTGHTDNAPAAGVQAFLGGQGLGAPSAVSNAGSAPGNGGFATSGMPRGYSASPYPGYVLDPSGKYVSAQSVPGYGNFGGATSQEVEEANRGKDTAQRTLDSANRGKATAEKQLEALQNPATGIPADPEALAQATQAVKDAETSVADATNGVADASRKYNETMNKPPPNVQTEGDKSMGGEASQLGGGLVKGLMQELGFDGSVFGDPTKWGIWKMFTSGVDWGARQLKGLMGGGQGGLFGGQQPTGAANMMNQGLGGLSSSLGLPNPTSLMPPGSLPGVGGGTGGGGLGALGNILGALPGLPGANLGATPGNLTLNSGGRGPVTPATQDQLDALGGGGLGMTAPAAPAPTPAAPVPVNIVPKALGSLPDQATIQPPTPHLVQWAEPSTGGEAFIPLKGGSRSIDIWAQTGSMLGVFEDGGLVSFGGFQTNLSSGMQQSPGAGLSARALVSPAAGRGPDPVAAEAQQPQQHVDLSANVTVHGPTSPQQISDMVASTQMRQSRMLSVGSPAGGLPL
jgi:SLT domain-containing protein